MSELFQNNGIEVDILKSENFLKIAETLTRIGICNRVEKKLWQSCHILHKKDSQGNSRYAILAFKELFKLDGRQTTLSDVDIERRTRIALLLEDWGLLKIIDSITFDDELIVPFTILPYKDKKQYELIPKYKIGTMK